MTLLRLNFALPFPPKSPRRIVIRRELKKRPAMLPFGGGQRKDEFLLEGWRRRSTRLEKEVQACLQFIKRTQQRHEGELREAQLEASQCGFAEEEAKKQVLEVKNAEKQSQDDLKILLKEVEDLKRAVKEAEDKILVQEVEDLKRAVKEAEDYNTQLRSHMEDYNTLVRSHKENYKWLLSGMK